jgi:hypothetical protein
LGALLGRSPTAYTNATVVDHALRGGEKTTLVGMRRDDLPTPFWRQIARVAVDVCYASVFGEHWALHALLGSRNSWRPVNACPAQPTGTDF